jgi:PAS domain S-box-containing protein
VRSPGSYPRSELGWRASSGIAVVVGGVVLIIWVAGFRSTGGNLGLVVPKANSAGCLILLGLALAALGPEQISRRRMFFGMACGGLAALVGFATLFEWVFGRDLGFDQLLFTQTPKAANVTAPGRMAETAAIAYVFGGAAVCLLRSHQHRYAQVLSLVLGVIALSGFSNFVLEAASLGGQVTQTQMALLAALPLMAVSLGILSARSGGLMSEVLSPKAGGVAARFLLPAAVLIPPVPGWLALRGERLGLYAAEGTDALVATGDIVALTALVWVAARMLNRMDAQTERAEEDLDRLFTLTPEFVCVAGLDGYFKRVNPTFMRVLGYAEDELLSMPFTAFIHPEDIDATGDVVVQLGTGNTVIAFNNRYRCKDGSYRWLSWNAVPVPEEGVMYCVARDITAEKRVDEINSARLRLLEFATAHSVDELVQHTLDEAEELSGSSIGFCHFVEDDQETLRLGSWSTRTMRDFCRADGQGSHYPISDAGVWVDCVHERRPVVHNDYAALPHRKGMPEGHAEVVRELVVPVLRDNKIRAILGVGNKATDYTEEDVKAVSLLADLGWEIAERLWAEESVRELNEELEQRVRDRTVQLEAANKELEAFSYSVSHDLRAPLRGIDGFSLALLEDYGAQLDEQGKDFLQRVRAGTQRMGHLIDDILALSRLTRTEMRRQTVDLSDLAAGVVDELRSAEPDRDVEVTIQSGLTAMGDPELLRVVLVNLLSNAWKFTGTQPEAHIEFGLSRSPEGDSSYFVRDNGVGFDMAYVGKLFGAFQRLHSTSDFPGTGIGLATVQRVIHRHGGQVAAFGSPGRGATFSFTLPGYGVTDYE